MIAFNTADPRPTASCVCPADEVPAAVRRLLRTLPGLGADENRPDGALGSLRCEALVSGLGGFSAFHRFYVDAEVVGPPVGLFPGLEQLGREGRVLLTLGVTFRRCPEPPQRRGFWEMLRAYFLFKC